MFGKGTCSLSDTEGKAKVFAFVSMPIDTRLILSLLACSLGGNNLTNDGKAMSGLLKLVEVLPQTKIESLECTHASKSDRLCVSAH